MEFKHGNIFTACLLEITERITSGIQDIMLHIHPESQENINYHRRPHSEEGYVNEIFPDGKRGNPQHFTDPGANPENLPFDKIFEPVHISNLVNSFLI